MPHETANSMPMIMKNQKLLKKLEKMLNSFNPNFLLFNILNNCIITNVAKINV